MAGSYVVPQVEIHQLFSEIPVSLTQNQVPFIFGPNYLLHRFDESDEKTATYLGEYVSTEQATTPFFGAYPEALNDDRVDETSGYTKLFGDNVLVKLHNFETIERVTDTGASSNSSDDYLEPSKLLITLSDGDSSSSDEAAIYPEVDTGRQLRIYYGTSGNEGHLDVEITNVDYDNSPAGKLLVTIDEEMDEDIGFTTKVFTGADLCEVQDGVEFPAEALWDSDKKKFQWVTHTDTDPESATYLRKGIQVKNALKTKFEDSDFSGYGEVLYAELYLTYRELITSAADTIHELVGSSAVATALGQISPDNPLAQAVYNAALNAGGQTIRYMAVPTNDSTGYDTVLEKATLTNEVYFLCPVTRDSDILTKVKGHVTDMSAATSKRWRIAFVSAEIPDDDPIYTSANSTSGSDFYAIVKSVNTTNKTADVQFMMKSGTTWVPSTDTKFKADVKENDYLKIKFSNKEWGKYVPVDLLIKKVVNNNTIRVDNTDGLLSQTTEAEKVEIYHPYTNAEKAEYIKNLSSSFASRRMYNIFPSVFTSGGVQQTGEFAAACVAGLVSSCLPQQPVTNMELTGIDDIPLVYQTFSFEQLNTMASGGTFIVMQDLPGDQVYVRHQISTAYEDNNLNTAELSLTKNLDSISYYFDNLCSPYIGKYNITDDLLLSLDAVIRGGLSRLTSGDYGLYGPQVIADGTSILLLEQDATLKDHINCNLQLNLPYPFNHLVLQLFV